jgi:hypothetical protein
MARFSYRFSVANTAGAIMLEDRQALFSLPITFKITQQRANDEDFGIIYYIKARHLDSLDQQLNISTIPATIYSSQTDSRKHKGKSFKQNS